MDVILGFIQNTAFIWIPILLGILSWRLLMTYKQQYYVHNKIKYKMLEINIPKDIHKSPESMEFVIDVLHHLGGGAMAWQHRVWYGSSLHPASLEIASIEGSIYFFIRASTKVIDLLKSTIYSQYPKVEVNEVDDYTRYVPDYTKNQDTWALYAADFKLTKDSAIPIKTYVDYGLDKNMGTLEEYQKIDPITPMLEYLSTLKKGEQIWIQYILRADPFTNWRKGAAEMIEKMLGRGEVGEMPDGTNMPQPKLSFGEQDTIKAIERSLSKYGFECIIRGLYLARKEDENPGRQGLFKGTLFKPFSSQYFNALRKKSDTSFDWIWEDPTGRKAPEVQRDFFKAYVGRSGFYDFDWKHIFLGKPKLDTFVLTSEELATLFHLPGRVSETSTLERIEATKAEPPTNLPI